MSGYNPNKNNKIHVRIYHVIELVICNDSMVALNFVYLKNDWYANDFNVLWDHYQNGLCAKGA